MSLLLGMMLSTTTECKAKTNIEEFKSQVQRACGDYIQSVALIEDESRTTYTILYALDLEGKAIRATELAKQALRAAVTSHTVLNRVHPMKHFEYSIKDTNGKEVCSFGFVGDNEEPTTAVCVDFVH
jgi:hypothetical protein